MLQISHLYADYGGKPALEDISLTLDSRELLVVLGPSGCGKTTLLNLIAGFMPYQRGTIQLAGKRVDGPGAERGVVFQQEGLLPWRNVQDNVALGLQLAGVKKAQRDDIAQAMLRKVGLDGAGQRYIWQLPAGNASAWVLPARWRQTRNCCCSTNLLARWMRLPASRCKSCCLSSGTRRKNRCCSLPMILKKQYLWPPNCCCSLPDQGGCWNGCRSTFPGALSRGKAGVVSSPTHSLSTPASMYCSAFSPSGRPFHERVD